MKKREILVFPQGVITFVEGGKEIENVCFAAMDFDTGDIINVVTSTNWNFGWADIKGSVFGNTGQISTLGKLSVRNYNRRFGEGNWVLTNTTKAKAYERLEKLVLERLGITVDQITKQVV